MIPDLTEIERFKDNIQALNEWKTKSFGAKEIEAQKYNCCFIYRAFLWFATNYECNSSTMSFVLQKRNFVELVITFKKYALL